MAGNLMTIGNVTVLSLSDGNMDGPVREMYGDEVARNWGCGCVSAEVEPGFSTNLGSFCNQVGWEDVDGGHGDGGCAGGGNRWGVGFAIQ